MGLIQGSVKSMKRNCFQNDRKENANSLSPQLEMLEVSRSSLLTTWVAEQTGMVSEAYLGIERTGFFCKTGSTVLEWQTIFSSLII